jgi:hypothetical protein
MPVICARPSIDKKVGSTGIIKESPATRPFTVINPNEGGKSIRI